MNTFKKIYHKIRMAIMPIPAGLATFVLEKSAQFYFDSLHEIAKMEGAK